MQFTYFPKVKLTVFSSVIFYLSFYDNLVPQSVWSIVPRRQMLAVKSRKLMRHVQPLLSRFAIVPGYIA